MSAAKTERLLNLVICLLSTARPLGRSHIQAAIPAYARSRDHSAFERMFERDKDELRELGIPLEVVPPDPLFGDDVGYRIDRQAYALPQVDFAPDELVVLALAARVWQQASLAGPATRALTKLRALGDAPDAQSLIGIEPRIHTAEPTFDAFWSAVRDRAPVAFDYRTPGQDRVTTRNLHPWSVTSWRGRWYVTGYDLDRQAARVFRLSRVLGAVTRTGSPDSYSIDPEALQESMFRGFSIADSGPESGLQTATIWVAHGRGHGLRQRAVSSTAAAGGNILTVEFTDLQWLVGELVSLGPAVRALAPPSLRAAVRDCLAGVVRGQAG